LSKRLALIIGNSLYRDKTLSKLSSPDADVGALTDTLLDPSLGGFDDVKLLVNSASHIVRREIFNFFSRKTRTDMLLFYFTGHGVLDDRGRLYLALKDTDTKALRGTAIPASYITDEMDNSRSKRQVLILDCCHSGAFARGSKGTTGANVGTASTFEGSGFGRVVLTASDATQYAWEGNQIIGEAVNSLFTHFIIKGIQTGEADVNRDGNISIDEIYDYAYSRILEETPKQTPGKWSFKEQGELIIAKSPVAEIQYEPSPPPSFLDEEEQKQMQKWYMDGLSAFWLEDWDGAIQKFEAILEKDPDYPDVVEKLEEARTHKKHVDLYNQAFAKSEEGEFEESIKLLESLIAEVPDYKDAARKLEEIQERKTLADLCSEARQLFESKKYQAVVRIFEKIHAIDPEYEDPDGLLEKSKEEEKKIERDQRLEDLYARGLLELDAGNLDAALALFRQINRLDDGYRDTNKLLARIENLILKEKIPPPGTIEIVEDRVEVEKDQRQIATARTDIQSYYRDQIQKTPRPQVTEPGSDIFKWLGILIALVVVIIGVSQLFGGSPEATEDSPRFEEPLEPAVKEEADDGAVAQGAALRGDLVIWHSLDSYELAALNFIIEYFSAENTEVDIEIEYYTYTDLDVAYEAEARVGGGPDLVISFDQFGFKFYDALLIADVSDLEVRDIDEMAMRFGQYKGVQVGLPFDLNGVLMFRNQRIIAEPASDFTDLIVKAEAATSGDTYGALLDPGFVYSFGHLYALGGALMTAEGDPAFNTPEGAAWLEMLLNFQALGQDQPFSSSDTDLFRAGKVGIVTDFKDLLEFFDEDLGADLVIDPWPGDMSGLVYSRMIFLNANSAAENKEAARAFMAYFLSAEAQTVLYETARSFIPSNTAVAVIDPLRQQALAAFGTGTGMVLSPESESYFYCLGEAISYTWTGEVDPESALAWAEECVIGELSELRGD
jgi:ABC-type glycerol-3-phosphate transport system substrate-binding protein/outer membrane protein assembly factor BamD (BamD/ComL family)